MVPAAAMCSQSIRDSGPWRFDRGQCSHPQLAGRNTLRSSGFSFRTASHSNMLCLQGSGFRNKTPDSLLELRRRSVDRGSSSLPLKYERLLLETASPQPEPNPEDDAQSASAPGAVEGWKKLTYLIFATLFFILGLLGVLLPGLPTTPFLLLTSYFLVRSYPALNARLLRSRLFGPVLTDWQVHGGVRPGTRIKAISVVVIAVGTTVWLSDQSPGLTLAVILLAATGIAVILRVPNVN